MSVEPSRDLPPRLALLQLLTAAEALEFGAYPAHGSGFVTILSKGDIGALNNAIDNARAALESTPGGGTT